MPSANPFFEESSLFLNYPQFGLIENSHYLPAFERGIAEQLAEVEAIANQQAEANFENTTIAMQGSFYIINCDWMLRIILDELQCLGYELILHCKDFGRLALDDAFWRNQC